MENNKKENFRNFNIENFNQTSEEDVGIISYIDNEDDGFECVLKHRYSDFIVNEIAENGNVVWLRSKQIDEQDNDKILKIIEEQKTDDSNILANKQKESQNNNEVVDQKFLDKKKFILNIDLVDNIIKNNFIAEDILDNEDAEKLKYLIIRYNQK